MVADNIDQKESKIIFHVFFSYFFLLVYYVFCGLIIIIIDFVAWILDVGTCCHKCYIVCTYGKSVGVAEGDGRQLTLS